MKDKMRSDVNILSKPVSVALELSQRAYNYSGTIPRILFYIEIILAAKQTRYQVLFKFFQLGLTLVTQSKLTYKCFSLLKIK